MNKPLVITCCLVSLPGVVILGGCFYHACAYGDGDYEAGNFHRNSYSIRTNLATGEVVRSWSPQGESTESPRTDMLDMWLVGTAIALVGPVLLTLDQGTRHGFT